MSIDWMKKIRKINCIQKENLIEVLEKEIKKMIKKEYSSKNDYKINKEIISVDIFLSNVLGEGVGIQPSFFIFSSSKIENKLIKKIVLNIGIQEYLSAMSFNGAYGHIEEYCLVCINDGFGWSVEEVKKMN